MNGNVISFQSVVENGVIRLPEAYQETFTAPVLVTVRENSPTQALTPDEITARLNEIYKEVDSKLDEDIQLAQYKLLAEEDW